MLPVCLETPDPMKRLRTLCIVIAALFCGTVALAHEVAPSYLNLAGTESESAVALRWDVPLAELRWIVDLDGNSDGTLAWEEVAAQTRAIGALATGNLDLARGARPCSLAARGIRPARHAGAAYASIEMQATCPGGGPLHVHNRLFFGDHPTHQVLLDVTTPAGHFNSALNPLAATWSEPAAPSWLATLGDFVRHGVWHIWIGYDHIAFLILLLLPSARLRGFQSRRGNRAARDRCRGAAGGAVAAAAAGLSTATYARGVPRDCDGRRNLDRSALVSFE
jgi:hypothetical protein